MVESEVECFRGVPLKLFVHKGTQQLARLVIIQGGCSTCSPKQSHNCIAVSLGPRLSLFSEVRYCFTRFSLSSTQNQWIRWANPPVFEAALQSQGAGFQIWGKDKGGCTQSRKKNSVLTEVCRFGRFCFVFVFRFFPLVLEIQFDLYVIFLESRPHLQSKSQTTKTSSVSRHATN